MLTHNENKTVFKANLLPYAVLYLLVYLLLLYIVVLFEIQHEGLWFIAYSSITSSLIIFVFFIKKNQRLLTTTEQVKLTLYIFLPLLVLLILSVIGYFVFACFYAGWGMMVMMGLALIVVIMLWLSILFIIITSAIVTFLSLQIFERIIKNADNQGEGLRKIYVFVSRIFAVSIFIQLILNL